MSFYPMDARRPGDLLKTHSALKGLFRQARAIERMQVLLDSVLEPAAREHCRAASYRDGVLRVLVTDSQWATRVRYQQKRLIRQLQAYAEFATLTKIHCRVQPPLVKKTPPVRKMRRSIVAAETLFETSREISDPTLPASLERLARHNSGDSSTSDIGKNITLHPRPPAHSEPAMAFRQQPGSFRCEACPISQADFPKNFQTGFQINK